ncbi:hypothetical protein F2Q68_00005816 [Brassica cretica]|uniref:Uncharacterized protein n=1 Tax=Brassica cretica TaxID=69181 RepID=A0A8S9JIG3_BRACR|nr:hypothetical protein F2Q68_00005816 [Brassica cretica]KAF3509050.1 hypothetical protein F2Q69_00005336 [Brassica cretica]
MKPRWMAAGVGARTGPLGLFSADGTGSRDWPRVLALFGTRTASGRGARPRYWSRKLSLSD